MNTRSLVRIALCAVVMSVCAWISVPFSVPFTLQTFGVYACLLILGGKRGTVAVALYIFLGAVGLPVFSGFAGGAGALFGATGGYILGFLLMALIYWALETRARGILSCALALGLGTLVCYAFGAAWFMYVYASKTGAIGLGAALSWCVFPFILPDAAKLALALVLSRRLKPLLGA